MEGAGWVTHMLQLRQEAGRCAGNDQAFRARLQLRGGLGSTPHGALARGRLCMQLTSVNFQAGDSMSPSDGCLLLSVCNP